jgi:hypothetical protein
MNLAEFHPLGVGFALDGEGAFAPHAGEFTDDELIEVADFRRHALAQHGLIALTLDGDGVLL